MRGAGGGGDTFKRIETIPVFMEVDAGDWCTVRVISTQE